METLTSQGPHESVDPTAAGSHGRYACSQCPGTFKRIEHLTRHQRSHGTQKKFICDVCSKGFARSDILHRHRFTHKTLPFRDGAQGRKRACVECAKAREGCSKDEPCIRCSSRGLSCAYPLGSRRKSSRPTTRTYRLDGQAQSISQSSDQYLSATTSSQGFNIAPRAWVAEAEAHVSRPEVDGGQGLDSGREVSLQHTEMIANMQTPTLIDDVYNSTDRMDVDSRFPMLQSQDGYSQMMDYPLNWLPVNDTIDIDYSSILGLNLGSIGSPINLQMRSTDELSILRLDPPVSYSTPPGFGNTQDLALGVNNHPNHATENSTPASASSPAKTVSSHSRSSGGSTRISLQGGLYATSRDGARVPCTARSKQPRQRFLGGTPIKTVLDPNANIVGHGLSFPQLGGILIDDVEQDPSQEITPATYEAMFASFRELCLRRDAIYTSYLDHSFPSFSQVNLLIRLYYEYFDPILPIIHKETTDINAFWPLPLAMSAIGCQYTDTEEFSQCVRPFHEFLRRALALEMETTSWDIAFVPLTQALVLSQIGMLYSGYPGFQPLARARRSMLVEIGTMIAPSGTSRVTKIVLEDGGNPTQSWSCWLADETRRRLGYSIWLLDSMSTYHFRQNPSSSLALGECELPNDSLWACKTAENWATTFRKTEKNPSLISAVTTLFLEKEVKKDIGEFGNTILLHGIYEEINKVQGYLNRPLSSWIPSVQLDSNSPLDVDGDPISRSGTGTSIANWRNAALDCVDVLHWAANATIANAAGMEHTTVLHLHLSRVVLLTPHRNIRTLLEWIESSTVEASSKAHTITRNEAMCAEQEVIKWAQRDEHKARLAVLHCGCFYWHIRRYSRQAFYEPISVFLATMTLWAYSSYTSRAPSPNRQDSTGSGGHIHRSNSNDHTITLDSGLRETDRQSPRREPLLTRQSSLGFEDDSEPTSIRLDRPNDDEMVQQFVRSGKPATMKAYITGIGDICSPQGPVRILREGRKILGLASCAWGRTREYAATLEAVEQATMSNSGP